MPFGFGSPLASFWGPVAGGLIGGVGQYAANRETRQSTAKQIAFQERMSNTAHQRQVADLRKAGINPILSAKLGGASSPAGSSYTAGNIGSAAVQGYQNVSSARQAQAQTGLIESQTELTKVNTEITRGSPKAVVSRIINALEDGLSGKVTKGPYGAFSTIAKKIAEKQTERFMGPQDTSQTYPKLTGKIIADSLAEAAEIGIDIPKEIFKMLMEF